MKQRNQGSKGTQPYGARRRTAIRFVARRLQTYGSAPFSCLASDHPTLSPKCEELSARTLSCAAPPSKPYVRICHFVAAIRQPLSLRSSPAYGFPVNSYSEETDTFRCGHRPARRAQADESRRLASVCGPICRVDLVNQAEPFASFHSGFQSCQHAIRPHRRFRPAPPGAGFCRLSRPVSHCHDSFPSVRPSRHPFPCRPLLHPFSRASQLLWRL